MKKTLFALIIALFALGGAMLALRVFSGPEDTWICQNGQWTAHGKPAAPKPTTGCGHTPQETATSTQQAAVQPAPGSDRDEHGCIGSAGYQWCAATQKCQRPWEELCETEINFSHAGVVVKEKPSRNGERLYLVYEEPGKPALKARLDFDMNSVCGDEQHRIGCMLLSVSDFGLTNGQSVTVKGIATTSDAVLVRQVTKAAPAPDIAK